MEHERITPKDASDATVIRGAGATEGSSIHGHYVVECVAPDGTIKWREVIDNVVCTVGKNAMLDAYLAGSGFTQTGPFLGLISWIGFGAGPAAGDTMSSHAGWVEAGNGSNYPTWTTPSSNARGNTSAGWAAASAGSKALSSPISFIIGPNGGTIKGCFIVAGSGAVATNANTGGTLVSAGTFTGGDKLVSTNDTVNVSYSLGLT